MSSTEALEGLRPLLHPTEEDFSPSNIDQITESFVPAGATETSLPPVSHTSDKDIESIVDEALTHDNLQNIIATDEEVVVHEDVDEDDDDVHQPELQEQEEEFSEQDQQLEEDEDDILEVELQEQHDAQGKDELVDQVELQRRKIEIVEWLQNWLTSDNITLVEIDENNLEPLISLNLYEHLRSGVLLCKALNNIMNANPAFTQNNLPPIDVNERADLFACMANLSNFVRTAELYFNIDRFRLFEPIDVLKTQDETPFINALYFLKLVLQETSTSFPVSVAKPYAALTFDQLSTLITMITSKPTNPIVAYDPRVVMSMQDVEVFQKLIGKMDSLETSHKTLAMLTISMNSKFEKMEKEQQEIKNRLDTLVEGILGAFEDVSTKLRELKDVTDVLGASAIGLHQLVQQVDNKAGNTSALRKLEEQASKKSAFTENPTISSHYTNFDQEDLSKTEISSVPVSPVSPTSATVLSSGANRGMSGTMTGNAPKIFKLPDEVLAKNLPKEEIMRQSILYEVIDSEADYVRDLVVMVEGHRRGLRDKGVLDETQIKTMFSNVDDLLPLNQQLLSLLVARRDENPVIEGVGDVFLQLIDKFMVYDGYCAYYQQALQLYKELKTRDEMKAYLDKTINEPQYRGLSLESFLIKPVQRICKYPLLFRELIKNTPKDHKDKPLLEACMVKIEEIVSLVNETTRAVGDRDKILELQSRIDASPPIDLVTGVRRLIKEGPIQKIVGGKTKDRYLIILSDMLLVCKQHLMSKGRLQFEQALDMRLVLINQSNNSKMGGGNSANVKMTKTMFEINHQTESLVFNAQTESDKIKWVQALEEALKAARESPKRQSTEIPTQRVSVSRPASATPSTNDYFKQSSAGALPTGGTLKKSNTLMKKRSNLWGRKKAESVENVAENQEVGGAVESQEEIKPVATVTTSSSKGILEEEKSRRGSMSSSRSFSLTQQQQQQQHMPKTADVVNYPGWKTVDAGNGSVYFFNTETNETSWYHPSVLSMNDPNAPPVDTSHMSVDDVKKIYQQRIDYMQRLQQNQVTNTSINTTTTTSQPSHQA